MSAARNSAVLQFATQEIANNVVASCQGFSLLNK